MKLMKQKEAEAMMKQQFREDLESMSEQLQFAIKTLDEKQTNEMLLLEQKLQYNIEGIQKTVDAKFAKLAATVSAESSQSLAFNQYCQTNLDSMKKRVDEELGLFSAKLNPIDHGFGKVKRELHVLNQAVSHSI